MEILRVLNSRRETAAALSLGVRTVDQLIQSGKLHAIRVGRRVLVSRDAIEAFARGVHPSFHEIEKSETAVREH